VAEIPDNLFVGGPATSRPVVLSAPSETVLRPRLAWRLLFGVLAIQLPLALVSPGPFEWPSLFFVVPVLWAATAAWRKKVVLRGDELDQQGTFTRYPVLRASEIAALTARRENSGDIDDDTRYVVLRMWLSDGTDRGYMRFWWGPWDSLARWIAVHHTKPSPDGIPCWTLLTDAETMRRLAPLLEAPSERC
jgi:hypothetical protein